MWCSVCNNAGDRARSIWWEWGLLFLRFMKFLGFCSFASLLWLSVIPTLAVLAVSFLFAGGLSVLGGILAFIKGVVPNSLFENITFVFFTHEISGIPGLLAGVLAGIVFTALGLLCWKSAVKIVVYLQEKLRKVKYRCVKN